MASVCELVHREREAILERWRESVRAAYCAQGLTAPELSNLMPKYLDALADGSGTAEVRRLVESHVSSRLRAGFRVDEAIQEFVALHTEILSAIWSTRGALDRPAFSEVQRLLEVMNTATAVVTESYARHLQDDEQTEKYYARRLQSIASEALRSPDGGREALRQRLPEMVRLVMNAMGAQSASLLLYDPAQGELVSAASAGVAEDSLEHYATSPEAHSFAAAVAGREGVATELESVQSAEIAVNAQLGGRGIRSLLGVRLPPHRTLRGVLYVGLSEQRSFTPGELRRIESLGQWITLHLDNAELYSELRRTIEDLQAERGLRERFVDTLAHDLRGPLTVARLHAQRLAASASVPTDMRDSAERVIQGIDRTDRMVRDLLDAHRIRAGQRLALVLAECDLVRIARDVVEELTSTRDGTFVLRGDEAVRGVWSEDNLRRALWNLVINAAKYGAKGRPVTVTVRRAGDGAEASVHNEGPAISPEDQARLFVPFSQIAPEVRGGHGGWGLGLTLVRGCAEAHGGSVAVRSVAGEGTTFTMKLPADARPFQPGE